MLLSLKSLSSSAPSSFPQRGPRERSVTVRNGIGRPGSKNMSKRALGFPRNLGDPVVSTEDSRPEPPGKQLQAHGGSAQPPKGANRCAIPWYRRREGNLSAATQPGSRSLWALDGASGQVFFHQAVRDRHLIKTITNS